MTRMSFFQSLRNLLFDLDPLIFIGFIVLIIYLSYLFRKNKTKSKLFISVISLCLFYYLFMMLYNIVGIPSLTEFMRLNSLHESLFNPHIYLVPLGEGVSLGFILNIFLFIPIGFLIPLISSSFRNFIKLFFFVVIISFAIEFSQLFTLYRATDINDLLTNTVGGMIGYLLYLIVERLDWTKTLKQRNLEKDNSTKYLPIIIVCLAFINVMLT